MHPAATQRRALTLIELLVVIAIIAVLIGLLLPAVQKIRESGNRTTCANNLKQLGLAVHCYHGTTGSLPPSFITGYGHASWMVLLLPHLEQDGLLSQWDLRRTYYFQAPPAIETSVKAFFCPSRRSPGSLSLDGDARRTVGHRAGALSDYAACGGSGAIKNYWEAKSDGAFVEAAYSATGKDPDIFVTNWRSLTNFDSISDGLSSTMLIGEKHVPLAQLGTRNGGDTSAYNGDSPDPFSRVAGTGYPIAASPAESGKSAKLRFGSYHSSGVCQFVFADGSVHRLTSVTPEATLGLLAARNDGRPVPAFE
jgi:prepilin-type N-terminal cleavage/methylation domain-containing protein/prepilin-type processing-associated H-X9-DG protein